ncbi:MAG: ParB/RepB/Spo0J family partition protein, partial [Gammaproteobacteria bacterium]|nr:ParB/RepB/Spo0J family partition protein [Gammaproteobacteria bacterium]
AVDKKAEVSVNSQAAASQTCGTLIDTLPVEQLQRGRYQPRSDMRSDSLQELAESIKQQGIMQPIVVRLISGAGNNAQYEIIAGERRWRAAQLAELAEVPVIIREVADEDAIALALIENIQRENLNPLEEALALDRLIDEFELTHEEAAKAVGRKRASVSNLLRLLELDGGVKSLVAERKLSMGHARAILALKKDQQTPVAKDVVKKDLSVRATEALVRKLQMPVSSKKSTAKSKDPDIRRLELDLTDKLGAEVSIEDRKGKGKLVIQYSSLDALDGILSRIK